MAKPAVINCPNGVATKLLSTALFARTVKLQVAFYGAYLGTANDVTPAANCWPLSGQPEEYQFQLLSGEIWLYNDSGADGTVYVWAY